MMSEVSPGQAVGKRFKGFWSSWTNHQAVIVFDDGTFFTTEGRSDYDGNIEVNSAKLLDINGFGDDQLVEAGICTWKELENFRARKKAAHEAQERAIRLDTYEQLRREFEKEK